MQPSFSPIQMAVHPRSVSELSVWKKMRACPLSMRTSCSVGIYRPRTTTIGIISGGSGRAGRGSTLKIAWQNAVKHTSVGEDCVVADVVVYRYPVFPVVQPPLDEDKAHVLSFRHAHFSRAIVPVAVTPPKGTVVHQAHLSLDWCRIVTANIHRVAQVRTQLTHASE